MIVDKSILKHGGLLALFAIVTTGLVSLTYIGTKTRIANQIQQQRLTLLDAVIPSDYYDNDLTTSCLTVTDPRLGGAQTVYLASLNGTPSAFAIETTATNGYSGDIDMIVGADVSGHVLGVRVLKHKETPGLGDKIDLLVSDWILSFNNKQYSDSIKNQWKVKKDQGQFDQFTGATITPRAVVGSVAQTMQWLSEQLPDEHLSLVASPDCGVNING